MALPWLTLIKAVPWADVIEHAPTVLSGAQKLWQRLPGRGQAAPSAVPVATPAVADAGQSLSAQVAELRASVVAAEQQLQELQARMLAQIEAHRRALRWVAGVAAVALVVALGVLLR